MSRKDVLHSPRLSELKRRRRQNIINKILFYLLGVTILLVFLSYLSRIDRLNISQIKVSGNKVIDSEAIKTEIQNKTSGHYLWIFPKTNLFFYPRSAIEKDLFAKFKRFKDLNLSVKDQNTLEVVVVERSPEYTWCDGGELEIENSNPEKCYFLDKEGYIFDEAPYFSGEVYFKFFGGLPQETEDPQGHIFAENDFSRLNAFKERVSLLDLNPVALNVVGDGNVKIYLSNKSTQPMGPEIIFKTEDDFEQIASNLESILTTEPFQTDFKKKYSSLLYIDLRFGNKVYYKFR